MIREKLKTFTVKAIDFLIKKLDSPKMGLPYPWSPYQTDVAPLPPCPTWKDGKLEIWRPKDEKLSNEAATETISITPQISTSKIPDAEKPWPPKNPIWPPKNHIHKDSPRA
jgi:hypothetical protein